MHGPLARTSIGDGRVVENQARRFALRSGHRGFGPIQAHRSELRADDSQIPQVNDPVRVQRDQCSPSALKPSGLSPASSSKVASSSPVSASARRTPWRRCGNARTRESGENAKVPKFDASRRITRLGFHEPTSQRRISKSVSVAGRRLSGLNRTVASCGTGSVRINLPVDASRTDTRLPPTPCQATVAIHFSSELRLMNMADSEPARATGGKGGRRLTISVGCCHSVTTTRLPSLLNCARPSIGWGRAATCCAAGPICRWTVLRPSDPTGPRAQAISGTRQIPEPALATRQLESGEKATERL